MERMGFVARIEEDLERTISQGRLPASRCLPSESLLARQYGVSRTTVREALLRLSARGLVVQHPGRKTRARAMDVSVTLENLSVALHAEGPAHPERRRLLEGYLELKREMTVELLSACCDHASESDLESLKDACFMLREEARWKERSGWVEREFNLLRLAAIAANRPGHFLLIQSLERSFWGMARRLLPHLDGDSICEWALAAFSALHDKDAQALKRKLPPLIQASDERLLRALSATPDAVSPPVATYRPKEVFREPPGEPHSPTDTHWSELSENQSHIEPEATRGEPWPEEPFQPSQLESEAVRDEPSLVEQAQESRGELVVEPRDAASEARIQASGAELDTANEEPMWVEQALESGTELDAAKEEPMWAEQALESGTELDAAKEEPMWVEQALESGTTFAPATCEPSAKQFQESVITPGFAMGEPSAKQLQESGTPPGAATCGPSVEQHQEVHSVPDAAAGELSAEFCANPSGCWTGSDPRRPAGGPPPESVP